MGVSGQRHAPAALLPAKKRTPDTHCTEGWVGPRAGLDGCVKHHPHQRSIPGPPSQLTYMFVKKKLQTMTADLLRKRPDAVGLPVKRRLGKSV
jgi:hypothetical protein